MYSKFGVGEGQTVYGFRMCNYETPSMHHQLPLSTVLQHVDSHMSDACFIHFGFECI